MQNIFDSHAHYDMEKFDEDRFELLYKLPSEGVCGIINCASDLESSRKSIELAEKYDYIYAACGTHPHEASEAKADYEKEIIRLAAHKKCVALGEIGLDYHYDNSPREIQKAVFESYLRLALELDMPVVVHDREAHEDVMRLLKKYRPKGEMHCFSGGVELAREVIKLGMYIGLGGAVTFKNARRPLEVAAYVPEEFLLLETDAPYMTPEPFRGKRCDSRHIAYIAQKIAEIRGVEVPEILNATAANARKLFGLK